MQSKYCLKKQSVYLSFFVILAILLLSSYLHFSKNVLTLQTSTNAKAVQPTVPPLKTPIKAITNGDEVGEDEYPYFVKLEERPDGINGYGVCGGALINESFIITAAHCVSNVYFGAGGTISVVIGVTRFSDPFMGYYEGVVEHYLSQGKNNIYIPENYNNTEEGNLGSESYDIALIRLPVRLKNIPTLSIPDPSTFTYTDSLPDFPEFKYKSDSATYIGIGATKAGNTNPSQVLMSAKISLSKVMSNNRKYGSARFTRFITNPPATIFNLFNALKSGACTGDSGGPVLLDKNNEFLFIGVIKGGLCKDKVNIATSIAFHSKWIIDTITAVNSISTLPNDNRDFSKRDLGTVCTNSGAIDNTSTKKKCLQHSVICDWYTPTQEEQIKCIQATGRQLPEKCVVRKF